MHCLYIAKLAIGNQQAKTLYNLGLNACEQGKFAEEEQFYKEALAIYREIGDREGEEKILRSLDSVRSNLSKKDVERIDETLLQHSDLHEEAKRLTKETGIPHEVNHVIPLSMGGKFEYPRICKLFLLKSKSEA